MKWAINALQRFKIKLSARGSLATFIAHLTARNASQENAKIAENVLARKRKNARNAINRIASPRTTTDASFASKGEKRKKRPYIIISITCRRD